MRWRFMYSLSSACSRSPRDSTLALARLWADHPCACHAALLLQTLSAHRCDDCLNSGHPTELRHSAFISIAWP